MIKELAVGIGVVVILALIILAPFLVIWSWNELFGSLHEIPYTIWTWLSVLILGAYIRSDIKVNKK